MMNTIFSSLLFVTCFFCLDAPAFNRAQAPAQVGQEQKDEEALAPLTGDERLLDSRDILSRQPDFIADLSFSVIERFGAHSGSKRIARKGSRYRIEVPVGVFVGEIGKTATSLDFKAKVYDDMQAPRVQASRYSMLSLKVWSLDSDITFTALGKIRVDGHECIKIEAVRKGEARKLYLYAARDLNNLVIVVRLIYPKTSEIQRLSNISLQVPANLLEIPRAFKPIEHDPWTKLEAAKVTFKGRPSQDFGVFRAPGGELFIWVDGSQYLVRPQEATAEIAFEGLLVNRSGDYIWRTKGTEAFSLTSDRSDRGPLTDPHAVITRNSVKFQSRSYDGAPIIEVSW